MTTNLPPKPDFMPQDAWDALMSTRTVEGIKAGSQMQLESIRNGEWETQGGPTCLLTTIGRKSGDPKTTPVNYKKDGDNLYVVGSLAGLERHPLWVLNLDAHREAVIELREDKWEVTAQKVEGAEREKVWPSLTEFFPLWGHFQKYCDREFMVFLLIPKS